jgi:hypothetical protein
MWVAPSWWSWLWGAMLVVLVLAWWWDARRRSRRQHLTPPQPRAVPPVDRRPTTTWRPAAEAMGPVSGWPHALDPPDAPPRGSPRDRPDL